MATWAESHDPPVKQGPHSHDLWVPACIRMPSHHMNDGNNDPTDTSSRHMNVALLGSMDRHKTCGSSTLQTLKPNIQ